MLYRIRYVHARELFLLKTRSYELTALTRK